MSLDDCKILDLPKIHARLDELQAAVLRAKLPHLDAENELRRQRAADYLHALRDAPVTLPAVLPEVESVWHLFVVRSPDRDALQAWLAERHVGSMVHYPVACHLQKAYAGQVWPDLPIAERLQSEVLSLPMGPCLGRADALTVADAVRAGACAAGASHA